MKRKETTTKEDLLTVINIETYHGLTTSKPLQLRCFQSG